MSDLRCAACGMPAHRYGRNEGMERFDPMACINILRGELEDAARLVADLTEQTRTVMGQDDDGTPNGKDYTERRLVSEWAIAAALTPGDPE